MSSWLKAAEDLFEVVDRRAKLVVNELADEQSDAQPPAANGNGSRVKKKNSKSKAQRRLSTNEPPKQSDTAQEQPGTSSETMAQRQVATNEIPKQSESSQEQPGTSSEFNEPLDEDRPLLPAETNGINPNSSLIQTLDSKDAVDEDPSTLDTNFPKNFQNDVNHTLNNTEIQVTEAQIEGEALTLDDVPAKEIASDPVDPANELILSPSPTTRIEPDDRDNPIEVVQNIESRDLDVFAKTDEETIQSLRIDSNGDAREQLNDVHSVGSRSALKKDEEPTVHDSPKKVQEQLDEAQGLLKSTKTTGQSKEARLARVCAGLSSRLQEYKSENAQLEELLTAERELTKSYEAHVKQLQHEISSCKMEAARVESNMVEALAAKNSEIESLVGSMDALKKQAALSEGNLSSLQANMESLMRNRELTETRMMQALREELASAERRAEEERAAHNATKMAAMEREVELEHRAMDSSTALARIQRIADERTSKAADLEQKVALLEVECTSLNQELQDMEARARRGQKKSSEEANQAIQIQAWQEEVERARLGQREAENKLSLLEAEAQKMRVEMAAMKRDADHYSRQEHMELEKRYRELTDLLYYKQTQLENMASEKAAAEFQLEKEIKRIQEAKAEAERSKISRRASTSWDEDADLKILEPLPLHHRHMARASIQLQKAAKFLDSGAVRATRFLWRYPTARVILLFYLVFVHLFLMYLLHRLQAQADSFAAREFESLGLGTNTLP